MSASPVRRSSTGTTPASVGEKPESTALETTSSEPRNTSGCLSPNPQSQGLQGALRQKTGLPELRRGTRATPRPQRRSRPLPWRHLRRCSHPSPPVRPHCDFLVRLAPRCIPPHKQWNPEQCHRDKCEASHADSVLRPDNLCNSKLEPSVSAILNTLDSILELR